MTDNFTAPSNRGGFLLSNMLTGLHWSCRVIYMNTNCTHVNEWDRGRLICVDCANKMIQAEADHAAAVAAMLTND